MKSKRIAPFMALGILMLVGLTLIGCSSDELAHILGGLSGGFVTTPKFLVATDADTSGNNVSVFPVDATSGNLSTAVAGSPFDMGIVDGMTIAVHPNGHFVYEADGNDGSIHQWNVNTSTGVPTDIAPKVINEGGTFYQPNTPETTHVLAITADGKLLYASNDDNMVSAYSIGTNGALTHIGDFDAGAAKTGALATANGFLWVTDTNDSCDGCDDADTYQVITMKIAADGTLTTVGSPITLNADFWLWSIAASPDGKFVQVGDEDSNIFSFTVGSNGALTVAGTPFCLCGSDARDIAFRPDGKFFYVSDDEDDVHSVTQNADGSSAETANSPLSSGPGQIAMDLRGKFLYVGDFGVDLFTIDPTTGQLTFVNFFSTPGDEGGPVGLVRVAP